MFTHSIVIVITSMSSESIILVDKIMHCKLPVGDTDGDTLESQYSFQVRIQGILACISDCTRRLGFQSVSAGDYAHLLTIELFLDVPYTMYHAPYARLCRLHSGGGAKQTRLTVKVIDTSC